MRMMMIGATHEVTGSCTYLEVAGKKFLVDYGMMQGKDEFEEVGLPVKPSQLDYVFLTHAHIDHSGLLPVLSKNGFAGKIFATIPTENLCRIMLLDSAHIQESEAEYANRKNQRKGAPQVEPLYTVADAEEALSLFEGHPYDAWFTVADGIDVCFVDAGHLLGSSSIDFKFREGDTEKEFVFSGDIGNYNVPLLRAPTYLQHADYVMMESTYGNRLHDVPPDYATELAKILQETLDRGGNVVIPSFAVGRTQELLYFIRQIKEKGLVKGHDHFPVYVDSPLASSATRVFIDNAKYCYDGEARSLLDQGINPIECPDLEISSSTEDSMAINENKTPKVIISASGMCEAGRIRHHLKHNLWRSESTILFVGYQAVGTLGRILVEGAESVKLFGDEVVVNAQIKVLAGVSGHADKDGLIRWISSFTAQPETVFINHGEDETMEQFTAELRNEFGYNAVAPYSGTEFDIGSGEFITITEPKRIKPKESVSDNLANAKEPYRKLMTALDRLMKLAKGASGLANGELSRITDSIEALSNEFNGNRNGNPERNEKKQGRWDSFRNKLKQKRKNRKR